MGIFDPQGLKFWAFILLVVVGGQVVSTGIQAGLFIREIRRLNLEWLAVLKVMANLSVLSSDEKVHIIQKLVEERMNSHSDRSEINHSLRNLLEKYDKKL